MPTNLESQIQQLLTKQKCLFCRKKVDKLNLAGFKHQKDFLFFLQEPICQDCWEKNKDLINSQNFSSSEQLKNTNRKLWNWIKNCKERQSLVGNQKQHINQSKNSSKKEERTIYEDWQKKLSNDK